jgi:hypothetical protein
MFIGDLHLILVLIFGIITGQKACDPRTFSPGDYPTILTNLEVVGSHPLKLRAHSRLVNSTDEITYEGMVLGSATLIANFSKFTPKEALVACRSLDCSEYGAADYTNWNQTETCEYKCPDGKKANRRCVFMVDCLKCKDNAMNLAECVTVGFFRYSTSVPTNPGSSGERAGVNLICRECGEEKQSY